MPAVFDWLLHANKRFEGYVDGVSVLLNLRVKSNLKPEFLAWRDYLHTNCGQFIFQTLNMFNMSTYYALLLHKTKKCITNENRLKIYYCNSFRHIKLKNDQICSVFFSYVYNCSRLIVVFFKFL